MYESYAMEVIQEYKEKIESLEAKVKELEIEKKKSFWHGFEHVVMNPESRNIQRQWEKWLQWEIISKGNVTTTNNLDKG